MTCKVVNSSPDAEDDMEDARDPNELFCKRTCQGEISPREGEGNG